MLASSGAAADQQKDTFAPNTRAAVVIGVNKSGGLPVLNAAVSGAEAVATWLGKEKFNVSLLTDEINPVRAHHIFDAVNSFVQLNTLEQLIIYFSGHGYLNGFNELWLLSGAPGNPNEAVKLRECVDSAFQSGIPNVVFISDACRSTAQSLGSSRVQGSLVFPNSDSMPSDIDTEVDIFFATKPGKSAYEFDVGISVENFQGIFTASFLSAFENPPQDRVKNLNGVDVVLTRQLKPYLATDVPLRAEKKDIKLIQRPESRILSGQDQFIGRALYSPILIRDPMKTLRRTMPKSIAPAPADIDDVTAEEFRKIGILPEETKSDSVTAPTPENLSALNATSGFSASKEYLLKDRRLTNIQVSNGIVIHGAEVTQALTDRGSTIRIIDNGNGDNRPAIITTDRSPSSSIMLQFRDGSGSVVAALAGYVATVVVQNGNVINVNYDTNYNYQRSMVNDPELVRLNELRALVATAASFGSFQIRGTTNKRAQNAERLADRIRVDKGIDPALGLYAAYAYAEANLIGDVKSVKEFMSYSLDTNLYDVSLLAGTLSNMENLGPTDRVPFCPMLTQGWELLRVKQVTRHKALQEAAFHLKQSLWTTFNPEGMDILLQAFKRGEIY